MPGRPHSLLIPLALLVLGLLSVAAETSKVTVVTTTLPVFSLAATVAGDAALVENLIPPGVEPHDYQITSRDLRKLRQAQLILINGLHLEDWMNRYLDDPATQKKVFPVATGFDPDLICGATPLLGAGGRETSSLPNPHFWLDPVLARRAADNILHRLQEADQAHASVYAANAARLDAQLVALHAEFERDLQPLRSRPFITSHDFFPYLARRYHLDLAGVVEIVPEIDPSLRYLEQLSAMIRRENVRVLFVEPYFSSKLANQLCLDLGVRRLELDPIETGAAVPSAYFDAMRQNLEHLKEGLRAATAP